MLKVIHTDYELDLENYEINIVEENHWFSDRFFTKYTFPFDLILTDELNVKFGLIDSNNISNPRSYYAIKFFKDGTHQDAVLEINEIEQKVARVQISYGFEDFPSFETKLSDLPLEKISLAESLFDHAISIINQTYPAVNYNFPQVHTDDFDPEDEDWLGFEKIINNYKDGAFLRNEFDSTTDTTYNRNMMIPMPYLLHVLKAGFGVAGYTLKGDILNDQEFKKACFFVQTEAYVTSRIEAENMTMKTNDYFNLVDRKLEYGFLDLNSVTTTVGQYNKNYTFPYKGRYKIIGNVYMRRNRSDVSALFEYKGKRIWGSREGLVRSYYSEKIKTVNVTIDVDDLTDQLEFWSSQIPWGKELDERVDDAFLLDVNIIPIAIYDAAGDLIPPIITSSEIDLTKCVPDITFGECVTAIKNWKNFDVNIQGSDVYMNYIESQLNIKEAINLSKFEIQYPRKRLKQSESFLLKFADFDSKEYTYYPVYVDVNGSRTSKFTQTDDTNEIKIQALPLPILYRSGVLTAFAIEDGQSKMTLLLYDGLNSASLNLTDDSLPLMLPDVYEKHWSQWLDFRIKSIGYVTQFICFAEEIKNLTTRSKVFMYNNYHLVRLINKNKPAGKKVYEVELELEKLK